MRIGPGAVSETRLTDGADFAAILAAAAAQDDTLVQYLATLTAMYAFDGTDLTRLRAVTPADGLTNGVASLVAVSMASLFNGTTWDRQRNNEEVQLLASAARTVNTNSPDQTNFDSAGVTIHLDVTAVSGTNPTLQVLIQERLLTGGGFETLVQSSEHTVTAAAILVAQRGSSGPYEGASVTSQLEGIGISPSRIWRTRNIIGGTTPSFTYSQDVSYSG